MKSAIRIDWELGWNDDSVLCEAMAEVAGMDDAEWREFIIARYCTPEFRLEFIEMLEAARTDTMAAVMEEANSELRWDALLKSNT